MYCSMFVCIPCARFMRIVQVFFSVFSVSLWQNYSTTYWSGMYTTSFCVGFIVLCVRRYFLRRGFTESVSCSVSEWVSQWVSDSFIESVSHSVNESASEWVSHLISDWIRVSDLMSRLTNSITHCLSDLLTNWLWIDYSWVSQSMSDWVSVSHSLSQSVSESVILLNNTCRHILYFLEFFMA